MPERGGNDEAALHEELLKSGYEAFNRRDSEHLRELMVPDFVWHEAAPLRPGRRKAARVSLVTRARAVRPL